MSTHPLSCIRRIWCGGSARIWCGWSAYLRCSRPTWPRSGAQKGEPVWRNRSPLFSACNKIVIVRFKSSSFMWKWQRNSRNQYGKH